MNTSKRTLNILAALVWYIGAFVLLVKGTRLLAAAHSLNPVLIWTFSAAIAGMTIGSLKARFIFTNSCRKNLNRIAAIAEPKIWQFYRPQFFLFLGLMIAAGATLSRMAVDNYGMLIGVTILDYSIGVALLASSYVYWQEGAFYTANNQR